MPSRPEDTFLFGASSMLGWSIVRASGLALTPFCNGFTRTLPPGVERGIHLDDELAVSQLFAAERPRLVIHCAGVCDVDRCEESPDFAWSVNVDGTRILADYAPPETRIVYCSSDHVFGGDHGPYDEDAAPAPISVYGQTRVAAERILLARPNTLVVRSGLWIGPSATGRIGHLDWLRYRHARGLPMTIIDDEIRSAVWAEDAARRVGELAHSTITEILNRHKVNYTLEWFVSGLPFFTAPGELSKAVVQAIQEKVRRTPELSTTGGTSDGRFIAPTGAQVVELGVLNASIHKVNENVRVDDVVTLSGMYERVMELMLAR